MENRHPRSSGERLLEELDLLSADLRGELLGQPSDVAPGAGQAGDQPHPHRIRRVDHDDRDGRCRPLGRQGRGLRRGDDHVHLLLHKVGGHLREVLGLALGPAVLEHNVFPLHVTQLSQTIRKRHHDVGGCHRGRRHQKADAANLLGRLALGGHRPHRRCASAHQDKCAPGRHSIT